jgi:hypothetical protein
MRDRRLTFIDEAALLSRCTELADACIERAALRQSDSRPSITREIS